jgi:hypothetical protein
MNLKQVIDVLADVPSDLADTLGWDSRKTLLDIYHDGRNADYVQDDDDFHRDYAGLIAVARYAMEQTLQVTREDIEELDRWAHTDTRETGAQRITVPASLGRDAHYWNPWNGGDVA